GQAVLAHQLANATAEGQSGNAGRRDHAAWGGELEKLCLAVEIVQGRACLSLNPAVAGVDVDALHGREIDHDTVVADGVACDVVAAAADCHEQRIASSKPDGRDD